MNGNPASLSGNDGKTLSLERCPNLLLIGNTPKGRGVFAKEAIPARTVLEICPVLVLRPDENSDHVRHTNLYNYTYTWPLKASKEQTQALPLGLGSLFNHSNHPRRCNVGWVKHADPETRVLPTGGVQQGNDSIKYITLRAIEAGEELCISYGPKERLTFTDVEAQQVQQGDEDEQPETVVLEEVTLGLDDA